MNTSRADIPEAISFRIDTSIDPQEQLKTLIRQYRIDEVECVIADIHGITRGKAMPASKFADMKPAFLPFSIFFQSITGQYFDFDSDEYNTEIDIQLIPDLSTLRNLPWARSPSLMVIHDLHYPNGKPVPCAPRNVLKRILERYEEQGWKPIVAPELEFYLTARNTNPDIPLEPPVGRSGRQSVGRQSYSIMAIDEYENIIEDIYRFAEAQGLEIETIIQEGGPAQLEINMMHGNPLQLADNVFIFKRLIREAALKHGCYATFMAKPMEGQPGSAMHIHQSIVDSQTGQNIFSDKNGEPTELFTHFLGGQQQYLEAATCILAPYVNSYRRFIPDEAAPINLEWSFDNRSVGLRVPNSGPNARRVENRVAGIDCNPYLALAASLACGYLGMMEKTEPTRAFKGDAYEAPYGVPRGIQEALVAFENCAPLQELLGIQFSTIYQALKAHEFDEYMKVVSPWEREHLLLTV